MAGGALSTTAAQVASHARRRYVHLSDTVFGYLLNLPALFLIFLLIIYPIVDAFWDSLHQYNLRRPNVFKFIGLQNYVDLVNSPDFWQSMWVTFDFTFWTMALVVILSTLLALVANENFRGRGFIRALILLPWAMPGIVNALMWQWIYNSKVGALNGLLFSLGLIKDYRSWIMDPSSMYASIIVANVWNSLPFATLIMLAALQSVPTELYDAARVDRASFVHRFWNVTLPWLYQPILIVLILQTLGGLRLFDIIYLLTGGGPGNATTTIGFAAYQTAFMSYDFGSADAYGYFIALLTLIFAIIYIRLLYHRGEIQV